MNRIAADIEDAVERARWVPTLLGRRRTFIEDPAVDLSTIDLVIGIRDVCARAVFIRLCGGSIARNVAAIYRPEGVP